MSIFGFRARLQESNPNPSGGGGGGGGGGPAEWLKPFGEHAKAFEGVKDPADLATRWTTTQTELKTLKEKPSTFDWRKELAGEDAEAGKTLARFADPKTFLKSFNEAQTKIRSGEYAKPLAADATPEQKTEWRKANGVPEKAEAYFEQMPDGLVIGKDDAPLFNHFAKSALDANMSTAQMHAAVKWYYSMNEQQAAAERDADKADRLKTTTSLRTEWGNDYQANMNVLGAWMDGLGKEGKALLQDAMLGDGTRLMNSVPHVKFLVDQARTMNPVHGLIPGAGEGDMKSLEGEIAKIEKHMGNHGQAPYYKGPEAEAMQSRYRDLITARQRLQEQKR